ncbi:MAG: hypothetical protein RLZZ90_89, partial [Actinomycetota bacterium]
STEERVMLKNWTDFYKANRGLLHTGRTVRTEHSDRNAFLHGVVSTDQSEALFMLAQLRPSEFSRPANIRLTGLSNDATYEVRVVEPAGAAIPMQTVAPRWYEGVRLTGAVLSTIGLKSPVLRPEQALLIQVKKV